MEEEFDGSPGSYVDLSDRGRAGQLVRRGAAIENATHNSQPQRIGAQSHLRTKLFNRSNRQLVLTDAGTSYLAACKRILADVTEAERIASGEYTHRQAN